jgi:ribosomal protein L40E
MDITTFAKLPGWLAPILLSLAGIFTLVYIILVISSKSEPCAHCGSSNPVEAVICGNCGESTLTKPKGGHGILVSLAGLLAAAGMIIALFSALPSKEPPLDKLAIGVFGLVLFIVDIAVMIWGLRRRGRLKQQATILQKGFYGGFCGSCGAEMLGGNNTCRVCGWQAESESPNWKGRPATGGVPSQPVELKVICNHCKTENPPDVRRCQNCSFDLLTYRPVWLRFLYFFVSLLVSAGAGWLAYQSFLNPNLKEALSFLGFEAIALGLVALILPFYGLYLALGKGAFAELLVERANRHTKAFPWQALSDLSHALLLASVPKQKNILSKRMSLYQSLGLVKNATRDELALTYARENNPEGGVGLYLGERLAGDSSDSFSRGYLVAVSRAARKDREKMFMVGRVVALGYCPTCKEVVMLNEKLRCPRSTEAGAKHHFGKPKFIQFVVPEDEEAGRAQVPRAMAKARKRVAGRIWTIIVVLVLLVLLVYLFRR